EDRVNLLLTHIRETIAGILAFDSAERVEPQQGFFEMGMDSLMAVELKNRLEASLNQSLPPTLAFDFPNCKALAQYLARPVSSKQPETRPGEVLPKPGGHLDNMLAGVDRLSEDEAIKALMQLQ